jgi:hypothetical protein
MCAVLVIARAYPSSSQDKRLSPKECAAGGALSTNFAGSLKGLHVRGNRQTVADMVVLWRELMVYVSRVADVLIQ